MSAEGLFCAACFAEAGAPCAWDCIGLASHVDGIEAGLESAPSVTDAHCLACHAATPAAGDALIARAMTVAASKAYAALHYRAELDEAGR